MVDVFFTCSGWGNSTTVDYHYQAKRHDEERFSTAWTRFPIFSFHRTFQTDYPYHLLTKFLSCIYTSNPPNTIYPISIIQASTFPMEQQENIFVYVEITKEFLFRDAMRHTNGKLSYPELQASFMPNDLNYVCKENIPIFTHVPNDNSESTLIHPSTISLPYNVCEQRILTLDQTYWIPLHFCNEWLFTTLTRELFTVLCGTEKF